MTFIVKHINLFFWGVILLIVGSSNWYNQLDWPASYAAIAWLFWGAAAVAWAYALIDQASISVCDDYESSLRNTNATYEHAHAHKLRGHEPSAEELTRAASIRAAVADYTCDTSSLNPHPPDTLHHSIWASTYRRAQADYAEFYKAVGPPGNHAPRTKKPTATL